MVPGPPTWPPRARVAASLPVTGVQPHDILPGAAWAATPASQTLDCHRVGLTSDCTTTPCPV